MVLTKSFSGRALPPFLVAAGLLAVCLPSTGFAQVTAIDMTRINIDIAYDDQNGWDLGAHDEFADVAYAADQVLFYVSEAERRTVPNNPDFAFLGADPGTPVWVLPQVFDPARLSVGVSAEEIADGTFAAYYESDPRVQSEAPWVKLTLKAVRGPGELSVWQNDAFGQPVLWMATSDGLTEDDAVFIFSGRDSDYNWAFTAPGIYEIDVVASGYLPNAVDPVCSDVVTYTFGVESR
jgi:surface-anchored protein